MSQIIDYESGMKRGTDRPAVIPRVVALACIALEDIGSDCDPAAAKYDRDRR